jgi:glycosyltransferase involved in cell wall biosynthesis
VSGRVLIVHALFDILGGGELFALKLTQALSEEGFNVEILTATSIDPGKLREIYGDVKLPKVMVKRVKEAEYLSKLMPGRLVRLRRLIIYRKYESIIEEAKEKYDLIFDTQSNLPTPVDISYIHFPMLLSTRREGLYWIIYDQLVKSLAGDYKIPRSGRVFVNSTWTAHMVYRVYGIIPDILYPPVDIEYFINISESSVREKIVVTISRFTPEKKLDKILDIARKLRDYTFIIIGSTGPGSNKVLEALNAKKDLLNTTNVEFKPNLPRYKLRDLLSKAMFYLHPEFTEHFGIAVIEAMSAGCVPIVYRDGGVWYDIVSKISNILGYNNIGEVPKIIRVIEVNRELYTELRKKSIEVSKTFNYENFKKNLVEKVKYVLRIKKLT